MWIYLKVFLNFNVVPTIQILLDDVIVVEAAKHEILWLETTKKEDVKLLDAQRFQRGKRRK
jgi:hypothetical protein